MVSLCLVYQEGLGSVFVHRWLLVAPLNLLWEPDIIRWLSIEQGFQHVLKMPHFILIYKLYAFRSKGRWLLVFSIHYRICITLTNIIFIGLLIRCLDASYSVIIIVSRDDVAFFQRRVRDLGVEMSKDRHCISFLLFL